MVDRLSLGREHRRLRRRRSYSSSADEHQSQHYAIIFNENPLEAGQAKMTGELVKLKRLPIPRSDDRFQNETASGTNNMLYLCIYEELSTQIIFPDAHQVSFNNYIDNECSRILGSEPFPSTNEIQSDCVDSIAFALSSWHANRFASEKRDVSRADVESVCNILLSSMQLEQEIDHYCSCYDDECCADQFISSLRLDLDANARYLNDAYHKQSDSAMTTPLRLIVTGPTSGRASYDMNSTQMGVKMLRRSIPKMPLISLVLQPGGNASEHASILHDHLLRACVKRLLIGRVLLHFGNTVDGHAIIRTSLSVKVPAKPFLSNRDELETLQFRVADIKSRNKPNDNDQRMYVILPSTRIIFEAAASSSLIQGGSRMEEIGSEKPTCRSKQQQTIPTPHQHLVESLRILVHGSDQQNRPLIPRVFLFSGPPGVGKTYAVEKAISVANSWVGNSTTNSNSNGDTVCLLSLRGSELLAMSGGSNATTARALEAHFEEAAKLCQSRNRADAAAKAVVIFLDECDALVSSHVVAAMLALLLDKMEGVVQPHIKSGNWGQIIVVGATNRVDVIPAFLRRPGRMENEVVFSPPIADERFSLLKTLLSDNDIPRSELQNVAEECVGYVAADLSALVRKAALLGIERKVNENTVSCEAGLSDHSTVTTNDLITAMIDTPASCLRDASLSAPPKTTWDDIAGDAGGAKTALRIAIEWPRTRREAYSALGLSPPRGVLLHGPPGCAKTTLARAAAGSAGVSFLSLAPADVYSSSFVGDAEAVVRRAFDLARSASPCVLFFDEIDAIIGGVESGRSHGMDRGGSAEARVLSTFLNEMDGVDGTVDDGVLVLAATNRPGTLDAALLRPGRFDKVIYVPSPDKAARAAILRMECNKWYDSLTSFAKETFPGHTIDIGAIEQYFHIDALACDDVSASMTGAEIKHACAEAAINVMRESLMKSDSLDHNPALAQTLLKSLKTGLEKALIGTKPILASSLDEYLRFDREHQT